MKPLQLRTSLTLRYTAMVTVLVSALALTYHFVLVRQLNRDATATLEEKARGLHGYMQFANGQPLIAYDADDPEAAAFIDDATDYYQVYDAGDGRLLTQSPGIAALGLQYTAVEVAQFREHPGLRDVQTDRGRLRLLTTVLSPAPGDTYVVEIGQLLDDVDKTIAGLDRLLLWRILGGIVVGAIAGRWLAGRALEPLSQLAVATEAIDITNLHERLPVRNAGDELDRVAQAFNQALARVDHAVGEMRQFSTALAHELRTPLAILRGEAELALRPSASDEERRQALGRQIDECDRLTRLINQILTLARAEAGEIAMASEPVDLAELSTSVADQIEPVATAQGIRLTCTASQPVSVRGDRGWLERLVLILLDNAIKYTPGGGHISMSVGHADGRATVAVVDTGAGIPADALPHVFERFFRADAARSPRTEGAGLGLALAKWIAEQHHGTIQVQSRQGEGSTFTASFPCA